jgi:hypothetical protein
MIIYNQNIYTNITLGNNPSSVFDIAKYGCYLVSMCNMFQYIGIHVDPITLNNLMKEKFDNVKMIFYDCRSIYANMSYNLYSKSGV